MIPPIVGVPAFFRCDCTPSTRSVCPILSFLRNGMMIGPKITLITKADQYRDYNLITSSSHLFIILSFFLIMFDYTAFCHISQPYVILRIATTLSLCPFYSYIWKNVFKNGTYHRCCDRAAIIDSLWIMDDTQGQHLGIFCRCKSKKRRNIAVCTSREVSVKLLFCPPIV